MKLSERQIEIAARRFCEANGRNPDEELVRYSMGSDGVCRPASEGPTWKLYVGQIKNQIDVNNAIREALESSE